MKKSRRKSVKNKKSKRKNRIKSLKKIKKHFANKKSTRRNRKKKGGMPKEIYAYNTNLEKYPNDIQNHLDKALKAIYGSSHPNWPLNGQSKYYSQREDWYIESNLDDLTDDQKKTIKKALREEYMLRVD